MSQRTILEINHDCLGEAIESLTALVKAMPSSGERDLKIIARESSAVRVLAQRNSADEAQLVINGNVIWSD